MKNNIKRIIKKTYLFRIADRLYDLFLFPSAITIKWRLKRAKKYNAAILLGTPIHRNIGDHLLANSEIAFLKTECNYNDVIEISTRYLLNNIQNLSDMVPESMPVFITGGGWMGDTWPEDQKKLETILYEFKSHKIVILPQTVHYESYQENAIIKKTKEIYSSVKSLLLFCRDINSYNCAMMLFAEANISVSLRPDMALYNRPYLHAQKESNQCTCCLREDREKATINHWEDFLKEYSNHNSMTIVNKSTIANRPIPLWRRKSKINSIYNCFKESDLIITDRLHGMIFAYLTSSPCIAIDNSTHKVKGVYEAWLKNNKLIYLVNDGIDKDDFYQCVHELFGSCNKPQDNTMLIQEFTGMAYEIKDFIRRNDR